MKKLFLFLIFFLIGIGLFLWVVKFVGWQEIKNSFLVFTGWQGLIILFLSALIILVGTWKWKEILKGENADVPFKDLFGVYLAGFSIMYLLPMMIFGGEIFRGYILKKRNSLAWPKGIASSIIDRILDWTIILIIIFLGTISFLFTIGLPSKRMGIIFGGTFLFFLAAISFFYFKTFKRESIAKLFIKFFNHKYSNKGPFEIEREIFTFFKLRKAAMWKSFFLSFLGGAISFLRAWLLINFLGKTIGFSPSLSILGFHYLAGILPIPASIGIQETAQVFVFNSLGLKAETGTVFTMIIRGAELIFAFLGIFILFRLGFKLLENSFSQRGVNRIKEAGNNNS